MMSTTRQLRYGLFVAGLLVLLGNRVFLSASPCDPRTEYCSCDSSDVCNGAVDCGTECKGDGGVDITCGDYNGGGGNGYCLGECGDGYCFAASELDPRCYADCGYCGDGKCQPWEADVSSAYFCCSDCSDGVCSSPPVGGDDCDPGYPCGVGSSGRCNVNRQCTEVSSCNGNYGVCFTSDDCCDGESCAYFESCGWDSQSSSVVCDYELTGECIPYDIDDEEVCRLI